MRPAHRTTGRWVSIAPLWWQARYVKSVEGVVHKTLVVNVTCMRRSGGANQSEPSTAYVHLSETSMWYRLIGAVRPLLSVGHIGDKYRFLKIRFSSGYFLRLIWRHHTFRGWIPESSTRHRNCRRISVQLTGRKLWRRPSCQRRCKMRWRHWRRFREQSWS